MNPIQNIPRGWQCVKLGDIFAFKGGGTPSKNEPSYWNGDISWASVKDIKGPYLLDTKDKITEVGVNNSNTNVALPGNVILVTRISPGKTTITKIKTAINQDLKIVIPKIEINIEFVKYLFHSIEKQIIELSSGTTVLGISLNNLSEISFPLPPLSEQHRIVAKIEELYSNLDKGIERLKAAQQQLKIYRQSVLKWAFEGRFTNDLILSHEQPKGWRWVRTGDFAFVTKLAGFEFTKYVKYGETGEIPVIRAQNVSKNGFVKRNFIYVDRETLEKLPRSRVIGGEILMVFVGAGLGNVAIVPSDTDYFLGPNVAKIAFKQEVFNKYAYYFFSSILGFGNISKHQKATAQGSISMSNIREVMIPLAPSQSEQRQIVTEIEGRLSVCEKLEENIHQGLQQAEALRRSILKGAFEGKLILQDSN